MVTASTRVLGVIGWPILHSRSPSMQNAAFEAVGLDFVYCAWAVPPHKLQHALQGAAALGIAGLNVTIPHKEVALGLCTPDALAREVGAVNTLVFDGTNVLGTNTDVHGFRMMMAEAGVQPSPAMLEGKPGRAVILGAGGAARAVAVALRTAGYRDIVVVSRTGMPVTVSRVALESRRWDSLPKVLEGADILVDATPRGLDPASEVVDISPLPTHAAVLDLAVKSETVLVVDAQSRGLLAATGTSMLLHQGAASFERWTGVAAPIEIMREALLASLT
jgi:shikimate dehydrogenase